MPTVSESTYKASTLDDECNRESPHGRRRPGPSPWITSELLDAQLWRALENQRESDRRAAEAATNGRWWDAPAFDPPPIDDYLKSWIARAWRAHTKADADWRPGHESRIHARSQLADFLRSTVIPYTADPRIQRMPSELLNARRSGTCMYRPDDDRWCRFYDQKAGLRLLCPDDSREESDRLYRRLAPRLLEWMDPGSGHQLHYLVFTCPHAKPGNLARRMRGLVKRFRKVIREFPCVTGSVVVLEAPLSAARRWNVHLNVIVTTDGRFLDYGALRARWHWQVECQRLAGGEMELRGSIRELLKYSVQAVPEKSGEKARAALERGAGGSTEQSQNVTPAPAMTEWTAGEWLEWWNAHLRFRRTRTYGELFRIGKPPAQPMEGFHTVGWFATYRGRVFLRSALLDSIQGDKSPGPLPRLDLETLEKIRGPPSTGPPSEQFGMFNV